MRIRENKSDKSRKSIISPRRTAKTSAKADGLPTILVTQIKGQTISPLKPKKCFRLLLGFVASYFFLYF